MITMVNQVSYALQYDLTTNYYEIINNETNFNKCEFRENFCELINLIINLVVFVVST